MRTRFLLPVLTDSSIWDHATNRQHHPSCVLPCVCFVISTVLLIDGSA